MNLRRNNGFLLLDLPPLLTSAFITSFPRTSSIHPRFEKIIRVRRSAPATGCGLLTFSKRASLQLRSTNSLPVAAGVPDAASLPFRGPYDAAPEQRPPAFPNRPAVPTRWREVCAFLF